MIQENTKKAPIFVNPSVNLTIGSNFAHIGSYVTTVMAYDPDSMEFIENYSILSQKTNPVSNKQYFKIDSISGLLDF